MVIFEPRRYATPYTQIIDFAEKQTTVSGVILATVPVYNASWIEVHFHVSDNKAQISVIPDSTAGGMAIHVDTYNIGDGACWVLVRGVPPYIATSVGSHLVQVTATAAIPGAEARVSGYIVLHGFRRD